MRIENMNTREYRVAMVLYSSALKIVTAKLEVINEELHLRKKNTPIEYMKSRLKTADSISAKLVRRGHAPTLTNAKKYIDDIAGVRIICSFTDDIYEVAQIIENSLGFDIITIKDYIKNPKPNGYRSYHMIVEVPVRLTDCVEKVRAEIQIRTIAMDFWASLEHKMRYKFYKEIPDELKAELTDCAGIVASLDEKMLTLNKEIDKYKV